MLINLSTGISVEAELLEPPSGQAGARDEGNKLAVCLHPWSWLGGRMDDPVLLSVAETLHSRNYHVLRFNSRGVGRSTGWASFTGFAEAGDLQAVIDWALETVSDVRSVVILGYSHGSLIASMQPVLPPPVKTSHILLSYALGPRGFLTLFRTSTYSAKLEQLIQDANSNVLIVYGDRDEFTAESKYKTWTQELQRIPGSQERLEVAVVHRGSHFWRGGPGRELEELVANWLP